MSDEKNPWKLGFIYYNPEDKRIFPPKRRPEFGWTVNFANWKSILAFAAMLACIALVISLYEQNH